MIKNDLSRLGLFSILALAAMTGPGAADNKIKSGILECDVSAGVGLIFREKQTMNCKFTLLKGGAVDRYTGSIDEVGLSIGATEGGILVWSVLAAQQGVPAGALAGTYKGISADASVGVGLGENILMGGSDSAFMLQPSSYEGQVGLNVAAGVTTVTLTWVP
jgi:Protein of unknown function (DUF992)